MIFKAVKDIPTVIELKDIEENPLIVYEHFGKYEDEVFYVLKNGEIYGLINQEI